MWSEMWLRLGPLDAVLGLNKGGNGGRRNWELTLRRFVVFAQFDDLVDVLTSESLLDDNDIALERSVNWSWARVETLTSSSNG